MSPLYTMLACAALGGASWFLLRDQLMPQREARLLRGERWRVLKDDFIGMLIFALAGAVVGAGGGRLGDPW